MDTRVPRSAAAWQALTPSDCRHNREPFDCLFARVAERRDLSDGAKLLHAALVSRLRTGLAWTQVELGERIGASRQKVWRLLGELVAAGLLAIKRVGLGRPNEYELLGIDAEDLAGRAPKRGRPAAGHQDVRLHNAQRQATYYPKKTREETQYKTPSTGGFLQTRYGHYDEVVHPVR